MDILKNKSLLFLSLYVVLFPLFLLIQQVSKTTGALSLEQNLQSIQLLFVQFVFFLILYPIVFSLVKRTRQKKYFIINHLLFSFAFVLAHIFLTHLFFNFTRFEPFNHEFLKHFKKFFFNFSHIQFMTFWFFIFVSEYRLKQTEIYDNESKYDHLDIYLVEAADHYLKLKTFESEKLVRNTLHQFEMHNSQFGIIRVHKSYAINRKNAERIIRKKHRYFIQLSTGDLVPVGRTYLKKVKQIFS